MCPAPRDTDILGIVGTYSPSTWEEEAGRLGVYGHTWLHSKFSVQGQTILYEILFQIHWNKERQGEGEHEKDPWKRILSLFLNGWWIKNCHTYTMSAVESLVYNPFYLGGLQVWSQPQRQRKFQASLGYVARPCIDEITKQNNPINIAMFPTTSFVTNQSLPLQLIKATLKIPQVDMVASTCNPITRRERQENRVQGQCWLHREFKVDLNEAESSPGHETETILL